MSLFWSQGAHPPINPTKSYKMTMPPIFSHNHILNCLRMPYFIQSPTCFHGLFFFVNTSLDYEVGSCYLIDISNSRYIIMISSFVHLNKNALIIFLLPLKALLYGTRQPFWVQNSALLVTGHLTNTFPLVMLDYRWWNLWSTCWKTYCQQK